MNLLFFRFCELNLVSIIFPHFFCRILCLKLSEELTNNDLEQLSYNLDFDCDDLLNESDGGLSIFEEIIRLKKISDVSIDALRDALDHIGRKDLIDRHCKKFASKSYSKCLSSIITHR